MPWPRKLCATIVLLLFVSYTNLVFALPSGGTYPPEFTFRDDQWYDSWGFNRNYYGGSDGYLPNVAYESLGANKETAYSIGERFKANYASINERAEAILSYVQRWTEYGFDADNVAMEGIPQEEWAWNADETAHRIDETSGTTAVGDCEDMAFLCATIYSAAGFEVALVSPPNHVALLIWLPEYDNANYYWDIPDDGKSQGWIWVEATGKENPLGWTPPDYSDGNFECFVLGFSEFNVEISPKQPQAEDDVTVKASIVSARGTISQVYLNYTIGNTVESTQMATKGAIFEALISRQPEGTKISGTISAVDTEGFSREQQFEYVVGQNLEIPPFLIEAAAALIIIVLIVVLLSRSKH
jgi:hypothetical protein